MRRQIYTVIGAVLAAGALALLPAARDVVTARPAEAQEAPPRVISVYGEDEVKAGPDMANVHLGVQSQGATADEAMRKTNEAMNAVIAAIMAAGIPEQDMQTTSLSLWPVQSGTEPFRVVGYQASNQVSVVVNDLGMLVWVMDGAVAAGANTSSGVNFGFKDDAGLRQRALVGAAQAARAKADALAGAMGVSIQGLHSISEGGISRPYPVPLPAAPMPRGGDEKTAIQPGQLTITASVTAAFLIE